MRRLEVITGCVRSAAIGLLVVAMAPTAAGAGVRERARAAPLRPVRVVSGGDEIPVLLVARGITTMLSLPDEAREALCGDLFDPSTGAGGYVVQRSGRDLFVKPLRAAGPSNLFVKTGNATFSFELRVVDTASAMRIVNVETANRDAVRPGCDELIAAERTRLATDRSELEKTRAAMETDLAARRSAIEAESRSRAEALAREWVARASVVRVTRRDTRTGTLALSLAPYAVRAGGRTYLECSIRNTGSAPVVIAAAELSGSGRSRAELADVVPPGAAIRRMLEFDTPATRDAELRLVDPGGVTILRATPFR